MKATRRKLPPSDPIFREGFVFSNPVSPKSTGATPTAGATPDETSASADPLQPFLDSNMRLFADPSSDDKATK